MAGLGEQWDESCICLALVVGQQNHILSSVYLGLDLVPEVQVTQHRAIKVNQGAYIVVPHLVIVNRCPDGLMVRWELIGRAQQLASVGADHLPENERGLGGGLHRVPEGNSHLFLVRLEQPLEDLLYLAREHQRHKELDAKLEPPEQVQVGVHHRQLDAVKEANLWLGVCHWGCNSSCSSTNCDRQGGLAAGGRGEGECRTAQAG
mmetsp:Transcript_26145/g.36110  ORF Transcript_26145/g.36110 Transcript_26145/m.36110 type:complete len:205 (-) Transcript_26145:205-819(-)